MSLCIVSLAFGEPHQHMARTTWPLIADYAARFGCDWRPHLRPIYPCERPAPWHKLIAIADALADHDEVLWLDSDVLVREQADFILDEVWHGYWQALVCHQYLGGLVPNTGVWLCRRPMLPVLVAAAMSSDVDNPWWEQSAIHRLMGFVMDGPTARAGELTELSYRTRRLGDQWNHVECSPQDVEAKFVHAAGVPGDRLAFLTARA